MRYFMVYENADTEDIKVQIQVIIFTERWDLKMQLQNTTA